MKDPQSLLDQLMAPPYNSKLKGSGELAFHLGCGFCRNSTGTLLCMDPGKCVIRMEELYFQYFKRKLEQRHQSSLRKETILRFFSPPSLEKIELRFTNHLLILVGGLYLLNDSISNQR